MKLPDRTHLKTHTPVWSVVRAVCDRFRCVRVLPTFIKERKLQICPSLMDFHFNLHSFSPTTNSLALFKVLQNAFAAQLISGWIYAASREMLQSFSFAFCCCCCCFYYCCCCPCHKTLTTTKLQENYPLMSNIYGRDGSSQAGKTLPPPEVEAVLSGCSNWISGEILTAPRYICIYILYI